MSTQPFKDLFSAGSDEYARYRPTYPDSLFEQLASLVKDRAAAWDCATGNGQAAVALAPFFEKIFATDASEKQLAQAVASDRVAYSLGTAEASGLKDGSVTLVTVAQAFHWFKHEAFYREVRRVARRDESVLALWSYNNARCEPAVDALRDEYYNHIVGAYWEPERRFVEEGYRSIAVPFRELTPAPARMEAHWSFAEMIGYLRTWSATKSAQRALGKDPLLELAPRLAKAWGDPGSVKTVTWQLSIRLFAL